MTVKAAGLAAQFFEELSGEFETLGDIARTHGLVTLTDLMYLHNTILTGGFIDGWPVSAVSEVVGRMPSGSVWVSYIRVLDADGHVVVEASIAVAAYR